MATTEPDGIWSPDNLNNFDWVAHFAQNAQSVQDALTALRGEFEQEDTGWITLSPQNSFTANPDNIPQYRRIGNQVWLRGDFNRSAAPSSVTTAATLPAGFRPASSLSVTTTIFNYPDAPAQIGVNSTGTITVLCAHARPSGIGYRIGGITFLVD